MSLAQAIRDVSCERGFSFAWFASQQPSVGCPSPPCPPVAANLQGLPLGRFPAAPADRQVANLLHARMTIGPHGFLCDRAPAPPAAW
jgi:hypothetical protein